MHPSFSNLGALWAITQERKPGDTARSFQNRAYWFSRVGAQSSPGSHWVDFNSVVIVERDEGRPALASSAFHPRGPFSEHSISIIYVPEAVAEIVP